MSLVGPRPLLMQYLGSLHPGAGAAPRGEAGHHRMGAGQWAECDHLGGEVRPGRLVRGQSILLAGPEDSGHDRMEGVGREGISAEGEATMPEFMGTSRPAEKNPMMPYRQILIYGAGGSRQRSEGRDGCMVLAGKASGAWVLLTTIW